MAMETIIPCVPMGSRVNRATWEGVEDLVRHCMKGIDPKQVVHPTIKDEEWSVPEVRAGGASVAAELCGKDRSLLSASSKARASFCLDSRNSVK